MENSFSRSLALVPPDKTCRISTSDNCFCIQISKRVMLVIEDFVVKHCIYFPSDILSYVLHDSTLIYALKNGELSLIQWKIPIIDDLFQDIELKTQTKRRKTSNDKSESVSKDPIVDISKSQISCGVKAKSFTAQKANSISVQDFNPVHIAQQPAIYLLHSFSVDFSTVCLLSISGLCKPQVFIINYNNGVEILRRVSLEHRPISICAATFWNNQAPHKFTKDTNVDSSSCFLNEALGFFILGDCLGKITIYPFFASDDTYVDPCHILPICLNQPVQSIQVLNRNAHTFLVLIGKYGAAHVTTLDDFEEMQREIQNYQFQTIYPVDQVIVQDTVIIVRSENRLQYFVVQLEPMLRITEKVQINSNVVSISSSKYGESKILLLHKDGLLSEWTNMNQTLGLSFKQVKKEVQVDCCVPFARSEYLIKKAFGKLGSNANIPTGCVYSALQSIALTKKQVETNQEKISVIQERIEKLHSAVRVLNSIPKDFDALCSVIRPALRHPKEISFVISASLPPELWQHNWVIRLSARPIQLLGPKFTNQSLFRLPLMQVAYTISEEIDFQPMDEFHWVRSELETSTEILCSEIEYEIESQSKFRVQLNISAPIDEWSRKLNAAICSLEVIVSLSFSFLDEEIDPNKPVPYRTLYRKVIDPIDMSVCRFAKMSLPTFSTREYLALTSPPHSKSTREAKVGIVILANSPNRDGVQRMIACSLKRLDFEKNVFDSYEVSGRIPAGPSFRWVLEPLDQSEIMIEGRQISCFRLSLVADPVEYTPLFVAAVLGRLFSIIDPDPVTSLIRQFSSQSPNQTVETKNKERNSESAYDPILLSIEYAEQYLAAALNSIRTQASELNMLEQSQMDRTTILRSQVFNTWNICLQYCLPRTPLVINEESLKLLEQISESKDEECIILDET